MKIKKNICTKAVCCLTAILAAAQLSGCSLGKQTPETVISVEKDGSISVSIAEEFDKAYYDKDELQKMILTEAAGYNRKTGEGSITVNKIEVKNGVALVKMNYRTSEDYAVFNDSVFFIGTPKQAEENGYDLNIVLSGTKNTMETVGKADILSMTDYTVLITNEKEPVALNGKAAYVSDNVTVSPNLKTVSFAEDTKEMAFVLYK